MPISRNTQPKSNSRNDKNVFLSPVDTEDIESRLSEVESRVGPAGLDGRDGTNGGSGTPGTPGKNGKSLNPRGEWDSSSAYTYLDLVHVDGVGAYVCVTQGATVTGGYPPDDQVNWMLLVEEGGGGGGVYGVGFDPDSIFEAAGKDQIGSWNATVSYSAGAVVTDYAGGVRPGRYIALAPNQGERPWNSDIWVVLQDDRSASSISGHATSVDASGPNRKAYRSFGTTFAVCSINNANYELRNSLPVVVADLRSEFNESQPSLLYYPYYAAGVFKIEGGTGRNSSPSQFSPWSVSGTWEWSNAGDGSYQFRVTEAVNTSGDEFSIRLSLNIPFGESLGDSTNPGHQGSTAPCVVMDFKIFKGLTDYGYLHSAVVTLSGVFQATYADDQSGTPLDNTTNDGQLKAPISVKKSASGSNVLIEWTDDQSTVTGYRVFKNNLLVGQGPSSARNYITPGSVDDEYSVSAYNDKGQGPGAKAYNADGTTTPDPPKDVVLSKTSDGKARVSWVPPTDTSGITGYRVFRQDSDDSTNAKTQVYQSTNTTTATWVDPANLENRYYIYYVASYGPGGQSPLTYGGSINVQA